MSELALVRLTPEDPTAWGLWPLLERRVRMTLPDLEPEAPAEAVIAQMRRLWVQTPDLLGAWFAVRPDTREIVAHMVGWIGVYWTLPCMEVYQLKGDPGAGSLELLAPMLAELEAWRTLLNDRYERQGHARALDLVRFYTDRPEAYRRWFRPMVDVRVGGAICTFRLSEVALPAPRAA